MALNQGPFPYDEQVEPSKTPFEKEVAAFLDNDRMSQETLDLLESQRKEAEELRAENERRLINLFIESFNTLPAVVQGKVKNKINKKQA